MAHEFSEDEDVAHDVEEQLRRLAEAAMAVAVEEPPPWTSSSYRPSSSSLPRLPPPLKVDYLDLTAYGLPPHSLAMSALPGCKFR